MVRFSLSVKVQVVTLSATANWVCFIYMSNGSILINRAAKVLTVSRPGSKLLPNITWFLLLLGLLITIIILLILGLLTFTLLLLFVLSKGYNGFPDKVIVMQRFWSLFKMDSPNVPLWSQIQAWFTSSPWWKTNLTAVIVIILFCYLLLTPVTV